MKFSQIIPSDKKKRAFRDVTTQVIAQDLQATLEGLRFKYGKLKTDIELTRIFHACAAEYWDNHKPQRWH